MSQTACTHLIKELAAVMAKAMEPGPGVDLIILTALLFTKKIPTVPASSSTSILLCIHLLC